MDAEINKHRGEGEPPAHLLCPITMDLFTHPLVTSAGLSYEADFLHLHMARNGCTDPSTRTPILGGKDRLIENKVLIKAVDEWKDKHLYSMHGKGDGDFKDVQFG